ncbi:MAG: cadherin domain-containing protein [Planctomycetaceae bacterium]|nr:cadherin domain-containing protein [Planctomycetaceae bacterium]
MLKTAASFDFETKSGCTVRVRSTDANGLFTEKSFLITVTNVNEAPTDISLSGSTVAENTASGTTVGTLATMDVDTGDTFTYTLVAGTGDTNNAAFAIDGSTLKSAASFDFETKSSYTVRVRVTDANGLFTEKSFVITVTNVNEAPTDVTLSGSTVAENAASGTTVGTLATTDVDSGDTSTYTLVAGTGDTDNGSFSIDGGTLKTAASFDFETKGSYTVRVRSTDADGLFTEKSFVITVTNVNEAPTGVTLSGSTIAENAASGTTVGSLLTTTESVFAIAVTNVNEGPADIVLTGNTVAENTTSGTVVGSLATTDVDVGDTFTYTLVSGTGDTDNGSFSIDGGTLKTTASFNFETKSSYTVRIRSTDANGLFTEKSFVITVTNVNEAPTGVTLSGSTIAENAASGTTVGSLLTTDIDAGDTFTYTLVSGAGDTDNAAFTIDDGVLKTAASFDFETKDTYTVLVRSTDANGLTTEKPFMISVTNVNEAPSQISLTNATIAENAVSGTTVGTLATTDVDAGDTFTYMLVSGSGDADNVFFVIDGNTLKTAASFDFEAKNAYSVRVRSTDADGLFTETSFAITVTNVNEPATIGLPDPFLNEVVEDVAVNVAGFLSTTGTFSVVDPDAGESTFATTLAVPVDQANLGDLSVAADGAYVYSVRNSLAAVQAIRAGETVIDRFIVRSADGTTRLVSFRIAGASDTLAGAVADGYLRNARVFADANANGQLDWIDAGSLNGVWGTGEGEAWTTTDNTGNFSFDFGSTTARLVTVGGIDISTNLPFVGSLQAPAGSTIINPLTTLVAATLAHNTTMSVTDAAAAVAAALGLPQALDLTTYDPLAQAAGDPVALVVQKAAAGVANVIVATVTNGIDTDAVLENLAELVTAPNPGPVNLQDSSVLASVLTVDNGGQQIPPPATLVAGLVLVNTAISNSQSLTEIAETQTLVQGGTPFTAPAFTSAATADFAAQTPGSFQFTASGYPSPTYSVAGSLPSGLSLASSGLLSGTPAAGTAGTYAFTVTATNGIAPAATQAFTLTIAQSDDVTVSVDQTNRVAISLAPRGVTITDLHTTYDARRHALTITIAGPDTMSGGGTGIVVDAAAKTVTVRLDVFPNFAGLVLTGNVGTDSIRIGRQGVNLAAVTRGAASQSFSIDTGVGSGDAIILGGPVTARAAGAVSLTTRGTGAGGIRLAAPVRTPSGSQTYGGPTTLVGNLALYAGGDLVFGGTVDGRRSLSLTAGGGISFAGAVGAIAPLAGLTVARAASVAVNDGLSLDGQGTAAGSNGLTIGSRVNNVVFAALGGAVRTIRNFSGAGIRFLGGSTGSVLTGVTSRNNGIGISVAPGNYRGTRISGNGIEASRSVGVSLDGARNLLVGGANSDGVTLGNRITGRLATGERSTGMVLRGNLFGSLVQGNTIRHHLGDGLRLVDARGVTIGGSAQAVGNTISINVGAGISVTGNCVGSTAQGNTVGSNLRGNGQPRSLRVRS